MVKPPPLKLPRIIELAVFISKNEGRSVPELVEEGFPKPAIYTFLAALKDYGVIEIRPGETDNERGARFRQTFYVTPLGKSFVSHALELQKLVS